MFHSKTLALAIVTLSLCSMRNGVIADDLFSVFDGKSLEGWKANERPECFTVVDGTMKLEGGMAHLFCVKDGFADLKNFEFKAEVKTLPGANSGVFFTLRIAGPVD